MFEDKNGLCNGRWGLQYFDGGLGKGQGTRGKGVG